MPTKRPDLAELRAFCAAVDLGTLGRAAISVGISQPALSKRLRSLEAFAGAPLLERSRSGVTPTSSGVRLYSEARRLLEQADVVERLLEGIPGETPAIQLAVSHTIAEFYLPPELVAYQADGVRRPPVQLTIANSSAVRRMVVEGRVMTGITAINLTERRVDDLEELDLAADEVVVAVPESHAWFRRKEIPQAALLKTPLVVRDPDSHDRRTVEAVLGEHGLDLAEPLVEVGSTAVAKREALQRSAPVLISKHAINESRDRLHPRPVAGLRFQRRFVIVCRSLASLPRPDRDFIAFLRRRNEQS